MTVHSFEERLEDAASHMQTLEEKVWQELAQLAAGMHRLFHSDRQVEAGPEGKVIKTWQWVWMGTQSLL
jgi:hypothetical protein